VGDVLRIANRGYVLNLGQIVLEGGSNELATNPELLDTYIGQTTSASVKGEANG
jgi:ABC-type branched-subunit amino acid transport system ATPase component